MRLYHGSIVAVPRPELGHAKRFLDFGPGFYVTSHRAQAIRWARRKAMRCAGSPVVSVYEMAEDLSAWRVFDFPDDRAWLDFVCSCRAGGEAWRAWDMVRGRVADDDVFKAVDAFLRGIWNVRRTLDALRYAPENDQIAFLSQAAMDACLRFLGTEIPEGPP